jgi:hypothetical protein
VLVVVLFVVDLDTAQTRSPELEETLWGDVGVPASGMGKNRGSSGG